MSSIVVEWYINIIQKFKEPLLKDTFNSPTILRHAYTQYTHTHTHTTHKHTHYTHYTHTHTTHKHTHTTHYTHTHTHTSTNTYTLHMKHTLLTYMLGGNI